MFKRVSKWAAIAVTALSLSGAPATAQSLASASSSSSAALYFHGLYGAEFLWSGGSNLTFGLANLTLGMAPVAYGSLPGIGWELGVYGYASNDALIGEDATLFAALTLALAGGRLSIGAPRNATDGFNDAPIPGGSLYLRHIGALDFAMLPYATWLAMQWNRSFLGLRFDRTIGPIALAISVMQLTYLTNTVTNLALGISHTRDGRRVFGTLDYYDFGASSVLRAALGASWRFGGGSSSSLWPMILGGLWTMEDDGFGTRNLLSLYATLYPRDRLGVTASIAHSFWAAQTIYGLSVLYELNNRFAIQAGVVDGSGSSPLWSLGIRGTIDNR